MNRILLCVCLLGGSSMLGRVAHAQAKAGEKYALLVGVRNYDKNELRNLPYSEPDVTELADLLRMAGYERVTLLSQTRGSEDARYLPTAENIWKSLKGLLRDKEKDDNILVAFAGHGVQFRGSD